MAALVLLACPARGQYDPDWSRHFRVGAMVGLNIKADFTLSGLVNAPSTGNPGPPNVHQVDHVYDDGYVRVDQTGNAAGLTGYYGYDRASQFNPTAQTLTMTTTTSLSLGGSSSQVDGGALPGLDLAYGGNFWYWKRLRIGWDLGFGLLPISITTGQQGVAANANQALYTFNTGTVIPPTAPYHGGPSGRGSTISDLAIPAGTTNTTGTAAVSEKLDVILYTIRLGPSVYWDFNRYLGMSVSAGPAMGIVSGDFKFEQTFTTAHRAGSVSGTEVVFGGYVNASLMYHLMRNGDLYLGGEYMPLGTATIGSGGNQGRLRLGGAVFVSAGINWPF